MQHDSQISSEAFERALRHCADERYGAERAQALESRLQNTARWLAYIAAAPLDFAADPPDHAGLDGERR